MTPIRELTLLDAVTANTTGDRKDSQGSKGWTFVITATGGAVSATVDIEIEIMGRWVSIHTETLSAAVSVPIRDEEGQYQAVRAVVSSYASGTITVEATGSGQGFIFNG